MTYQESVVLTLLRDPAILKDIYSYPKYLNELIDVPNTEDTAKAWVCEDFYYRFMNLINTYPFLVRNKNVLDFGCNIGTMGFTVAPLAKTVTGIDRNEYVIYLANFTRRQNKTKNISFICGDGFALSLAPYTSILLLGNMLGISPTTRTETINTDTSRAVAFYNKLNELPRVCVVTDLSEDPARIGRNFLYTDVAKETLRGFVIKKYDLFMLYIKE